MGERTGASATGPERKIALAVAEGLLAAALRIGDGQIDLAERRRALLDEFPALLGADAGFWAWGRGRPDTSTVAPVAIIDFGFSDQERAIVIEWGLSVDTDIHFRQPIMAKVRHTGRSTDCRRDIVSDEAWGAFPYMRQQLARAGYESWLHSVRYSDSDTWSNFLLLRRVGCEEFGAEQVAALEVLHNGVPWLQSTAGEYLRPEAFEGLTARQRTVMLLLLDGLARKAIARQLNIGEETVGDHIKSIYAHFGVGSAGELAALFLRGR